MATTKVSGTNLLTNAWTVIESRTVSASSLESFTGLSPGIVYKLHLNLTAGTSTARTLIRFNSDATSDYEVLWAASPSSHSGTTRPGWDITMSLIGTANPFSGEYSFNTEHDNDLKVLGHGIGRHTVSSGALNLTMIGVTKTLSGALSSVQFLMDSGTFTGDLILTQLVTS